jgi:hypothetical protein
VTNSESSKTVHITEEAETAEACLSELQEQRNLARLATEITIEPDIAERTAATESITHELVTFVRGQSDLLSCEWAVPCLKNRSGGDLYLYPGFVLYRVTRDTFAVINVQDVNIEYVSARFIEREAIPARQSNRRSDVAQGEQRRQPGQTIQGQRPDPRRAIRDLETKQFNWAQRRVHALERFLGRGVREELDRVQEMLWAEGQLGN